MARRGLLREFTTHDITKKLVYKIYYYVVLYSNESNDVSRRKERANAEIAECTEGTEKTWKLRESPHQVRCTRDKPCLGKVNCR